MAQKVGTLQRYDVAVNDESFLQYAKHGLMGVAVTSGHFFDGDLQYVSGAPHAQAAGQVYFFAHETRTGLLRPLPELTLIGEDYGAAFGLSLEKCDLNGDGSVTVSDLLSILADFGCTEACSSDVDGDGLVSVADLLTLLSVFGVIC